MNRILVVLEVLLPFIFFLAIVGIVLTAQIKGAKRKAKGRSQRPQTQSRTTPSGMGRAAGPAKGEGHDHIRSTELSHNRKLEQLKALKDAGLLTQEEYEQRQKKISRGQ